MSLRVKALCALLLLAACGFQPVHGSKTPVAEDSILRAGVAITTGSVNADNSDIHVAQLFKNDLEDLLLPAATPGQPPAYEIHIMITETSSAIGVSRDGTASRYNLILSSTYSINRAGEKETLTTGIIRNVTSYNNPNNQYFSIYVALQDVRKRGVAELAEMYRQRLISYTKKTLVPVAPSANTPPPLFAPLPNENRPQGY